MFRRIVAVVKLTADVVRTFFKCMIDYYKNVNMWEKIWKL